MVGQPLPLTCKWFTISSFGEPKEIEGVNGAFYQPSADDIGNKIMVQAYPSIESGQYIGNPVTAEVGPLIMDSNVERRVQSLLEANPCFLSAKIEAIFFNYDSSNVMLPCEGQIVIDMENLIVTVNAKSMKTNAFERVAVCIINQQYPVVEISRKSNNAFELSLGPVDVIKFLAENNIERDVAAATLRMFCGQKALEKQLSSSNIAVASENQENLEKTNGVQTSESEPKDQEKPQEIQASSDQIPTTMTESPNKVESQDTMSQSGKLQSNISNQVPSTPQNNSLTQSQKKNVTNVEVLMKMEQLSKELQKVTKEREALSQELEKQKESNRKMDNQLKEVTKNFDIASNNLLLVIEENEKSKKENERLVHENLFFQQDINLYKTQLQDLKDLYEQYTESGELRGPRRISAEKNEIRDKYEATLAELQGKISRLEIENIEIKQEQEKFKEHITQLTHAKEALEGQNNHLNKKYQSLVQEKEKLFIGINNGNNANSNSGEGGQNSGNSSGLVSPTLKKDKSTASSTNVNNDQGYLTDRLIQLEEKQRDKEKIQSLEEENKNLKEQVQRLSITNETLKVSKDGDKSPKKGGLGKMLGFGAKDPKKDKTMIANVEYLQKLANSLTETIGEKEIALENQRSVNKELGKKIQELEENIKEMRLKLGESSPRRDSDKSPSNYKDKDKDKSKDKPPNFDNQIQFNFTDQPSNLESQMQFSHTGVNGSPSQ